MAERLHPGVYVEEVSSGVRPVEGVSTSTAAFVGEAVRGIPNRAHFLTSFADFTRTLGGHAQGDKGLLAQAVEAFFANGGQRAYAVRVLPDNAETASSTAVATRYTPPSGLALLPYPKALSFEANGDGAWADALRVDIEPSTRFPNEAFRIKVSWVEGQSSSATLLETFDDVRMDPSSEDYVVSVVNKGSHYIKVIDELGAALSATPVATLPIPEEGPVIATSEVAESSGTYTVYAGTDLFLQTWVGESPSGAPTKVSITLDATPTASQLEGLLRAGLVAAGVTNIDVATVTLSGKDHVEIRPKAYVSAYLIVDDASDLVGKALTLTGTTGASPFTASIASAANVAGVLAGFQGGGISAKITASIVAGALVLKSKDDSDIRSITVAETATPANTYGVSIPGRAGATVTSLNDVHITISESRGPGVRSTLQKLGLGSGARARGYSQSSPANPRVRPVITAPNPALALLNGSDGDGVVELSQFSGDKDKRTGLHALDAIDVNLVAVPGKNSPELIHAGVSYCDARGDCFFLADGPGFAHGELGMTASDVVSHVNGLGVSSKNTAIYFPWIQVPDPTGVGRNPTRYAPPSGFMAGIYARTDNARGVWKAPAGLEAVVSGALGLQLVLADAEQDALNPKSVNCIRQFPAAGTVSWGARTLSSDAEWRYVPVRRTALFLKESLRRGMQWAVFEPNGETLWDQMRANITSFMLGLFRQGAFQGTTPDEAFRVRCDRSTNPQESVDAGIVTAEVAFAPLKPAEFVVIQISQKSLVS